MVTTLFGDEIVSATQLKKKWKHYSDIAVKTPISIRSGSKAWVMINREQMRYINTANYYAEQIIRFSQELSEARAHNSNVFPWINTLNDEEIKEFYNELVSTFSNALNNRNWRALEEILDAWITTSEAKTNPEIIELLSKAGRPREYVKLKD